MEIYLPTDLFEKPPIKKLLKRYQHGIAIYILVLTLIHKNGGRLENNQSFIEHISQHFNLPVEYVRKVVNHCIKLKLLNLEDKFFVFSGTLEI